jgi:DNA-binding NarL/FixJ family response regulator
MIRVFLADDEDLVRGGMRALLAAEPDIVVVGEAANGYQTVAGVRALRPDVVLMDLRMARIGGIAATRALQARPDAPQVLVLTTFDADDDVLAALQAGAAGFLLKDTPPADIVDAIKKVARGEPLLSPSVTRRLMDLASALYDTSARDLARARLTALTDRERSVALFLGQGLSNAEIGDATYLSTATVKAYVSRLLEKLHLTNRVQIALLVQQADLDVAEDNGPPDP